jgi:hypothetical protein
MLSFLHKYARNLFYSQNGEEGIIIQCVRRFADNGVLRSDSDGHCVEIGGHDGKFCSNTGLLIESHWSGLFVEADYDRYLQCKANWAQNSRVRSQCCRVDGKNINAFVDHMCDLLSLDTDGSDYQIFQGLNAKPKIVIIEIDSSYPPDVWAFNPDGAGTYRNTVELGIEKGYFLLCHTGNLVFVANEYRELFPETEGDGLSNAELYFKKDWLRGQAA